MSKWRGQGQRCQKRNWILAATISQGPSIYYWSIFSDIFYPPFCLIFLNTTRHQFWVDSNNLTSIKRFSNMYFFSIWIFSHFFSELNFWKFSRLINKHFGIRAHRHWFLWEEKNAQGYLFRESRLLIITQVCFQQ